ncbi:MAG: hypothetical protein KC776_09460 [Myxococcales bacterium]|nr:hypothetical protein [Myxococcales bacterium]MCB9581748.1 hypothetical protein [Polyangiaceae bacterium]
MTDKKNQLEGEGSYRGTRRYDAGVREKIDKGEVADAAKRAKEAVEGPQGKELTDAAEKTKQGSPAQQKKDERAIKRAENEGMLPTP